MAQPQEAEPLDPLLARVRDHDEAASRALVERLYPLVSRVVRANLPRRDEPEDLMQEVFLKMFAKLEQFHGEVPFEHWVSRIALTTCLDQLRRQKARPEWRWADLSEEEQSVLESRTAGAEPSDADAPRALELLNQLLEQLPASDAWLLRQVELEQRSLAEVCAEAGWNGGAPSIAKTVSPTGEAGMRAAHASLQKLILAARKAPAAPVAPSDTPVPFGFSTRVAARWVAASGPSNRANLWERLCWWGASASVAVCLMAIVSQSFQPEQNPFDPLIEAPVDGLGMF